MNKLYSLILRLVKDERGQDMVEYALLAGFIAVAAGRDPAGYFQQHQHHL